MAAAFLGIAVLGPVLLFYVGPPFFAWAVGLGWLGVLLGAAFVFAFTLGWLFLVLWAFGRFDPPRRTDEDVFR
jgi:hypothetical protein